MNWSRFFSQYIWWHYHAGLQACWRHASNMPRLVWHLFAPFSLLRTLFAPFERLTETYSKRDSWEVWLRSFMVNVLMRLVGAVTRLTLIFSGIICSLTASLFAVIVFVGWVALPVIILLLIVATGITAF